MKESDWTITHKTVIKVAELLGLEKSYVTLFILEQIKNLNGLEQLIEYFTYFILVILYTCIMLFILSYVFSVMIKIYIWIPKNLKIYIKHVYQHYNMLLRIQTL